MCQRCEDFKRKLHPPQERRSQHDECASCGHKEGCKCWKGKNQIFIIGRGWICRYCRKGGDRR